MKEHNLYSIQDPTPQSIHGLPEGPRAKLLTCVLLLISVNKLPPPVYTHTVGCDCVCSLCGPEHLEGCLESASLLCSQSGACRPPAGWIGGLTGRHLGSMPVLMTLHCSQTNRITSRSVSFSPHTPNSSTNRCLLWTREGTRLDLCPGPGPRDHLCDK